MGFFTALGSRTAFASPAISLVPRWEAEARFAAPVPRNGSVASPSYDIRSVGLVILAIPHINELKFVA